MLFAMPFNRQSAVGNWVYPLVSAIAVFFLAAVAVYVLTNVWREHADGVGDNDADTATPGVVPEPMTAAADATPSPLPSVRSAGEILDCRLAAGEISIKEYDKLLAALARRQAAATTAAAAAPMMNGAAATPAAV
jgi:hypothetical protein